jgi:hypothetical protein
MVSLGCVEDDVGAVIHEGHEGKLPLYSTMKVPGISFKLVSNPGCKPVCGVPRSYQVHNGGPGEITTFSFVVTFTIKLRHGYVL